jgi:hypothetical protein
MAAPVRLRPRFRLLAVIRVLALLGVFSLISLWGLLRATRASAADVLVQLGEQLMQLPDAHYGGGVRQLWINGLSLMLQSGSSEQEPAVVTAQFRAACVQRSAVQLEQRESAALGHLKELGWLQSALDGVMVQQGEAGTSIVCLDALNKPWDVLSIAEAAQRFVRTGDLQEMGRVRYAQVRPTKSGSTFLTMWTDGPARLLEQFPRDHDAPGMDFPDVARIGGSQRFLSARLSDSLLAIYAHRAGSLEDLAGQYRAALSAGGYQAQDTYAHGEGHQSYRFEKGPRHVQLTLATGKGVILASLMSQP